MYKLLCKDQHYATGLQFAVTRFASALAERKDLVTPAEHRVLFQNSEEVRPATHPTPIKLNSPFPDSEDNRRHTGLCIPRRKRRTNPPNTLHLLRETERIHTGIQEILLGNQESQLPAGEQDAKFQFRLRPVPSNAGYPKTAAGYHDLHPQAAGTLQGGADVIQPDLQQHEAESRGVPVSQQDCPRSAGKNRGEWEVLGIYDVL